MKIFSATLFVTLLVPPAARAQSAPPSADSSSLAQQLTAKSKAVLQNMKSKDVTALNALLSNDFRIVWSDGKLHEKGELLGAAQEGMLRNFQFYSADVVPIDSDSAVVTFNLIADMPEGDDGLAPRYQRVSDLWVREGGDWRLKFEQATPLRPVD
ncbi:MAG: hypothetical protein JWN74_762 [Acidobacteriaceae bacterium]|nr:hypothetical protein [Acidobacteriaceae bacterium]